MQQSTIYKSVLFCFTWLLVACCWLPLLFADQLPSLFRGVVVADSPFGVRVVSVDQNSQAYQADLRPADVIIRVDDEEISSIDQFAVFSKSLKNTVISTDLLIFRNGLPKEVQIHLYSYPVLRTWGIKFVPDHDLRFAQPHVGEEHWMRMGRGYLEAERVEDSLNAYLNALHHQPMSINSAVIAAELFSFIGQQHIKKDEFTAGIASLRQSLILLESLFDYSLTDQQLELIRSQLRQTVAVLRKVNRSKKDQ